MGFFVNMEHLHDPLILCLDISMIEYPLEIKCPVCGESWLPGNEENYCPHVAFDFTPECRYIVKSLNNGRYEEDSWQFLDDLFRKGCEEKLLVYTLHSEGMACGPISDTSHFGFSLKEWSEQGVRFE